MSETIKRLVNLDGRTVLVTGAGGFLGRTIAVTLAELGARLLLVDRHGTPLADQCHELKETLGGGAEYFHCDLEQEGERTDLISWLLSSNRKLNVLINNAAFVGDSQMRGWAVPFAEQSVETWRRAIEVNLTAAFHLCQGLTPALASAEGASIINVASIYGQYAPDWGLYEGTNMSNPAAYSVSKGGLLQLTRWLATTLAPKIRVNAICPGGIARGQPASFVKKYEARTPLGRMATEDDFRGAVTYLATDMSAYVTGQSLFVDGGWGIW